MKLTASRLISPSWRRCFSVFDKFQEATRAVPKLSQEPSDDIKLQMYALYNQANKG